MNQEIASNDAVLKIMELSVSYYRKPVLTGASLEIRRGEVVALFGANGAGKSTLLKTIVGLTPANSGRIIYEGREVAQEKTHRIMQMGIGYMVQDQNVFPSLTVEEHFELASDGRPEDASYQEVYDLFPALLPLRKNRAGLLSGGLRQMVGFGMLLVRKAKFWLLDEPSSGLAPQIVRELMNNIRNISRQKAITVLFAEQNLRESLRIAGRACVVKNGTVLGLEEPSLALKNGKLEEIFLR